VRRAAILVAVALAVALGACGSGDRERDRGGFLVNPACPPAPTARAPRAPAGTITVTGREQQRIDGWGASVVGDTEVEPLVDPVGLRPAQLRELDRLVFGVAGIDLVRVFGPGFGRAEVSAPPARRTRDASFAFMRRVAPYGVRFMFTGARAPAAFQDGTRLRAGAEAAYGRWIAAYLRFARDVMGLPFSFAAVANEPDNSKSRLVMTPAQSAQVYASLAGALSASDQHTRLVLGDNTGWSTACPYVAAQLRAKLAPRAAAVASHAYIPSAARAGSLAEQARRAGLPLWQTEWGTGCASCPERDSMHLATRWSARIANDLIAGRVAAWFAFRAVADSTHGPGDALIVRERANRRRPWLVTRRFDVLRQYTSVAPRGARRLDVASGVRGVEAVAFRDGARVSLVLTNLRLHRPSPVRLVLGPGAGALSARRTSERLRFAALAPQPYAGRPVVVNLPPQSVTTYTVTRLRG
jgi:O-glycosyl hydrolase